MTPKSTKRRSPGDGGVYSYKTGAGERWYWKATVTLADSTKRVKVKRGYLSGKAARDAMRDALTASGKGEYADPSKQPLGAYLAAWLDGLRLAPSTVASDRKNVRLHIEPYIGGLPLAALTSARLTALYRELETSGRRDGKGRRTGLPLSARTVRYVATILGSALGAAVDAEPALLARNPAAKAQPPTAEQARAPEMHPWNAGQLAAFLAWSAGNSVLHVAWWVLSYTGMRRGELLALRWRDIDLEAGTIAVRRPAALVRVKGQQGVITEGATKNKQSSVVDIDAATVALLKAWKRTRGALALLLASREPVKVVSERIGHKSVTVTLTVYGHVMPGNQRAAADGFATLIREA